jgi:NADPH-dependent 2,4-dienoyl-CoA reductase/sulfur reductase-like enzyme
VGCRTTVGQIRDHEELIALHPEDAVHKRGINLKTHHEAVAIDREAGTVRVMNLKNGTEFVQAYDTLVLATGARAVMPDIPGMTLTGVFPLKEFQAVST